MWGRKCDAFFQSTSRLTSLPGSFGTCTNLNQTIISRQLGAFRAGRLNQQNPNGWQLRLLRTRDERPSGG
jgi:hypothetical protein